MLELAEIQKREMEIVQARANLQSRIKNTDGALELIALFKADIEAKEKQKADEMQAQAEGQADAEPNDRPCDSEPTAENVVQLRGEAGQ